MHFFKAFGNTWPLKKYDPGSRTLPINQTTGAVVNRSPSLLLFWSLYPPCVDACVFPFANNLRFMQPFVSAVSRLLSWIHLVCTQRTLENNQPLKSSRCSSNLASFVNRCLKMKISVVHWSTFIASYWRSKLETCHSEFCGTSANFCLAHSIRRSWPMSRS